MENDLHPKGLHSLIEIIKHGQMNYVNRCLSQNKGILSINSKFMGYLRNFPNVRNNLRFTSNLRDTSENFPIKFPTYVEYMMDEADDLNSQEEEDS